LKPENDTQLKEIIALDDSSFSLADIELIVKDDGVKKRYEEKYHGLLYSKILLLLTHESYEEDKAELLWNKIMNHLRGLNHTDEQTYDVDNAWGGVLRVKYQF